MQETTASFDVRTFFKGFPRFYYVMMIIFGPAFFSGLSPKKFLARHAADGTILNIGSGPRVIGAGVTNVDIHPYEHVDIVADAAAVPLPNGSVSLIVSDNVLEHVRDPEAAVYEMHRLLKSGGYAYVAIPFLYPFHSSPNDYQRYSREGLRELFREFEMVEIGVRSGPFSALLAWLAHTAGVILSFGSPALNSFVTNASLLVFFPVKFLDLVFAHWPNAHMLAAILYCVVRKK